MAVDNANNQDPSSKQVNPEFDQMNVMQGAQTDASLNMDDISDALFVTDPSTVDSSILDYDSSLNNTALTDLINGVSIGQGGPDMFVKDKLTDDQQRNVDVGGGIIGDIMKNTTSKTVKTGLEFGVKSTNFDRYFNHPKFKNIGFHPYSTNTEEVYNANSTWWDENTRMRTQFGKIFSTGFMSTYDALGDLADGDYLSSDTEASEAYADAMRIGNSSQEGAGAFFNNLQLNAGYTVGIMANIAVEELALAGLEAVTFGGATPLVASRTAYNIARGAKALDKTLDVAKHADKTTDMMKAMNNVDWAKDFWKNGGKWIGNKIGQGLTPSFMTAVKEVKTLNNSAKALSTMAKGAKYFGAFYRDARALNLAIAESKLEGGGVKSELINELYNAYVEEHGEVPEGDALKNIVNKGDQAGFATVMANAPIIFFSNAIVFDNMLRGFKGIGNIVNASAEGVGKRIVRRGVVKEGQKAFIDGGKTMTSRFLKRGFSGNLKTFAGSLLNYTAANITEGFQELAQESIAVSTADYYRNLYNDPMMAGYDATMASTWAGVKSQASGEGFHVFMSGFLMGGLVQGPQKLVFQGGPQLYNRISDPKGFEEYQANREKYVEETINVLNDVYENPETYFDPTKLQAISQKMHNEDMFSASYEGDVLSFMDSKDNAVFQALHTVIESGKMYEFKSQMEDYLKLDDEGLSKAMAMSTKDEIKSGKTRSRLESMLDRMEEVEKNYRELNDILISPYDSSQYKKGTPEHLNEVINQHAFNHAKMLALYTRDTFERALARSNQMYKDLASDPIMAKMATNDIDVLSNTKHLIQEIQLLKSEIKNLEGIDNSSEIKIIEDKISTLEGKLQSGKDLTDEQKASNDQVTLEIDSLTAELESFESSNTGDLTGDEKVDYDKKSKRLELLQNIFSIITNPQYTEETTSREYVKNDELTDEENEAEKKKEAGTYDKSVSKLREDILSSGETDTSDENIAMVLADGNNPFGNFDINNSVHLRESVLEYLEFVGNTEDDFIKHDKIDDFISKIIDVRSLRNRAVVYNKAFSVMIDPGRLHKLALRMGVHMKQSFIEGKKDLENRIRKHVDQTEKTELLSQLSKVGILPDPSQTELFLLGLIPVPTVFRTKDGPLTVMSNKDLFEKKDEIIGTYLNLTDQKLKEKQVEKKESVDIKHDPQDDVIPDFEDSHFDGDDAYVGSIQGDNYLKGEYNKYVDVFLENPKNKGKEPVTQTEWLNTKASKKVKAVEHAITRLTGEHYTPAVIKGFVDKNTFYEWLNTNKDEVFVKDILKSVDLTIEDLLSLNVKKEVKPEGEVADKPVKKSAKVKTKKVKVKDSSGNTVEHYILVDESGKPVDDRGFPTATGAKTEAKKVNKESTKKAKASEEFTFGGKEYKKGDTMVDSEGVKYRVFSTKESVDKNGNIYLKKEGTYNSRKKKDKLYFTEAEFKKKGFKEDNFDYSRTKGKIKINDPLIVNPAWDFVGLDKGEYESSAEMHEEGKRRFWNTILNMSEEDKGAIQFIVKSGPKWENAQGTSLTKKDSFTEAAHEDAPKNDLIKKHAQELWVEVIFKGQTLGFFMGPTSLIFLSSTGKQISGTEITANNIDLYFKLKPDTDKKQAAARIRNNYKSAHYINEKLKSALGTNDSVSLSLSDLKDINVNFSPGSMDVVDASEGVQFGDLKYNTIQDFTSEDTVDGSTPYLVFEYTREYVEGGYNLSGVKTHTNVKPTKALSTKIRAIKKKLDKHQSVAKKLGKYFAVISTPNGEYRAVYLTTSKMSAEEANSSFLTKLQDRAGMTMDNNINTKGQVKDPNYNNKWNESFQKEFFIASETGIYYEIKLDKEGNLRVDVSDLTISDNKKGKKKKVNRSSVTLSVEEWSQLTDVEDLFESINDGLIKKSKNKRSPGMKMTKGSLLTMDHLKKSVDKNITGEDIQSMDTRLSENVIKDITMTLSVNEAVTSINVINRTVKNIAPVIDENETADLTEDEKGDIVLDDYNNVPEEKLQEIAGKLNKGEELDEFETLINEFRMDDIKARRVQMVTTPVTPGESLDENIEQDNISKIIEVESKIKDRKQEIIDGNMTAKASTLSKMFREDVILKQLNKDLNRLNDDSAFKITDSFDGHDVEDINVFTKWVKDNLPEQIRVEVDTLRRNLKAGNITVGMFILQMKNISGNISDLEGVIKVGTESGFKYHEAFHSVFRMLLSEEEIVKYIQLAKKSKRASLRKEGKSVVAALQEMREQHPVYAEMSDSMLEERLYEEHLADEFDKFKMNPSSTKIDAEVKSLFRRIIDFIMSLLSDSKANKGMNALFRDIDAGKYRYTSTQSNRFTQTNRLNEEAYKLKLGKSTITRTTSSGSKVSKRVDRAMPSDQEHQLISAIASAYMGRLRKAEIGASKETLMNDVIDDIIALYNPDRSFYTNKGSEWNRNHKLELLNLHEGLIDQVEEITNLAWRKVEETNIYATIGNSEELTDEDYELAAKVGDWDKDASMIGGVSSLPKIIRQLISTTTIANEDFYGNMFINEDEATEDDHKEALIITVDAHTVYNGLLKVLSDETSDVRMLQKMWLFGQANPHTGAVVENFFTQVGIMEDALSGRLMEETYSIPEEVQDSNLFITFLKGFNMYRTDYMMMQTDKQSGVTHMYIVTKKDNTRVTINQWAENFNRKFRNIQIKGSDAQEDAVAALSGLSTLVNREDLSNMDDLKTVVKELLQDTYDSTGIQLHENYVLYNIYMGLTTTLTEEQEQLIETYKGVEVVDPNGNHILDKMLAEAERSIGNGENLFTESQIEQETVDSEKGGIKYRLKAVAMRNSHFDEAVGASTFIGADGNRRYAHQQPTFHLVKVAEMQGADYVHDKMQSDVFLEKNTLLKDPKFKEMVAKGKVKVIRIDGNKEGRLGVGDHGIYDKDLDKEGKSFGEGTPSDFILNLFNSYLGFYNRENPGNTPTLSVESDTPGLDNEDFVIAPSFIRVIEAANTGDMVALPVHKMVDINEAGISISKEALDKFENEIRIEYEAVMRYHKEDQTDLHVREEKLARLTESINLLTKLKVKTRNVKASFPWVHKSEIENIIGDEQSIILSTSSNAISSNLSKGDVGIVDVDGDAVKISSQGLISANGMSKKELDGIRKKLGPVVTEYKPSNKSWKVTINNNTYYVQSFVLKEFFEGSRELVMFDVTTNVTDKDTEIRLSEKKITVNDSGDVFDLIKEAQEAGDINREASLRAALTSIEEDVRGYWDQGGGTSTVIESIKPFKGITLDDTYGSQSWRTMTTDKKAKAEKGVKKYELEWFVEEIHEFYDAARMYGDIINRGGEEIFGEAIGLIRAAQQFKNNAKVQKLFKKVINDITKIFPLRSMFEKEFKEWKILKSEKGQAEGVTVESLIEFVEAATGDTIFKKNINLTEADLMTIDTSAVDKLTEAAKAGVDFDTAFNSVNGRDIVEGRLVQEINEMLLVLKELKALPKVTNELTKGFGKFKVLDNGGLKYSLSEDPKAKTMMSLYNLRENDPEFNIAQVYLNNYINTKSFNQVLLGDQSASLKDAVDAVKRAKMQNGAGININTSIKDESLGVQHRVEHISMVTFEDSVHSKVYDKVLSSDGKSTSPAEGTDGQMYITDKANRYIRFALGKLNKQQASVMDKVTQGQEVEIDEEFFGELKEQLSYKEMDSILNSMKLVFGDGKVFLKMSAVTLTKNLTSTKRLDGSWVAKEGWEELHNMRVNLERVEQKAWVNGLGTIAIGVPASASKMLKKNVIPYDKITGEQWSDEFDISENEIHGLSAEFMRLQLENPSNKMEIVDPRQIKNLITGEQPETEIINGKEVDITVNIRGEEITIKDLKSLYHKSQNDKDANAYFARRNLMFTWKGSTDTMNRLKDKNRRLTQSESQGLQTDLHSFIKFAVQGLKASQAKSQMLSYFEFDEDGSPKFNLNNPMTQQKYEELMFSYFSKGVIASKQPGISAALMSDAGIKKVKQVIAVDENGTPTQWRVIRDKDWVNLKGEDAYGDVREAKRKDKDDETDEWTGLKEGDFYLDRLRSNVKEYDENGDFTGVTYTEMIMPAHHSNVLKFQQGWAEKLPDAVAKMFGIRIPSQDKHSAVNLKVVDFMPVYYGSTAVFARELIELSGADFDIDKLYMQIKKSFYDPKSDKFVEYGDIKGDEQQGYMHYVKNIVTEQYLKKSILKESVSQWRRTNEHTPIEEVEEKEEELARRILAIPTHIIASKQLFDIKGLTEGMRHLGMPVTYAEYVEFKRVNNREPYNDAVDNNLLDQKFALLGHTGMVNPRHGRELGIAHEPAVLTPLNGDRGILKWMVDELGDVMEILSEDGNFDKDSFLGQLEAWTNNKEGARSIGAVVLPNIVMSILSEYKIKINDIGENDPAVFLNDIRYHDFSGEFEINHETGEQDTQLYRKQFIISALVTAMTDNAKERLAAKLGLKKGSLAILVTLLGMGVDLKTTVLLINAPTIREAFFHGENKDGKTSSGYKGLLKKRFNTLDKVITKDEADNNRSDNPYASVSIGVNTLTDNIRNEQFDRADDYLTYGLDPKSKNSMTIDQMITERSIIEQFLKASEIADVTRDVSNLVNLQKGFGRDLAELEGVKESADNLGLELSDKLFEDANIALDLRPIFKEGSHWAGRYELFKEFYNYITPELFLKRTKPFLKLRDTILASATSNPFIMTAARVANIENDIISYLTLKVYDNSLSKKGNSAGIRSSLQNGLIYDDATFGKDGASRLNIKNVISRIKDTLDAEGKKNHFIDTYTKLISHEHEDNSSGIDKLESNTWARFSDSEMMRIQNSLMELHDDHKTHEDVMHIIHYLAVRDGLQFGSGSFLGGVTSDLLYDMLNSVDSVHKAFKEGNKGRELSFGRLLGADFDTIISELTEGYLSSRTNEFIISTVGGIKEINHVKTESIPEDYAYADLIIDFDRGETSAGMSSVAFREFTVDFTDVDGNKKTYTFGSVMHAVQVLRSGEFDETLDAKYRKGKKGVLKLSNVEGKIIPGKKRLGGFNKSLDYMFEWLTEESLEQNLDEDAEENLPIGNVLASTKNFRVIGSEAESKGVQAAIANIKSRLVYLVEKGKEDSAYKKVVSLSRVKRYNTKMTKSEKNDPILIKDITLEDGTSQTVLEIDMFKGLGESGLDMTKFKDRVRSVNWDKRKGESQAGYTSRKKTMKASLRANVKMLKKMGISYVEKDVKTKDGKTKTIKQYIFPSVIKRYKKGEDSRYFALKSVYTDGKYVETVTSEMVDNSFNVAIGNKAEYVEIDLSGSTRQNGTGFMWGSRPTHKDLIAFGEEKESQIERDNDAAADDANVESEAAASSFIAKIRGGESNTDAVEESVETEVEEQDDVSEVEDYDDVDSPMDVITPVENSNVVTFYESLNSDELVIMSENGYSSVEEFLSLYGGEKLSGKTTGIDDYIKQIEKYIKDCN